MGRAIALMVAGLLGGPAGPPEGGEGGGAPHAAMLALSFGDGVRSYWLFEPIDPKPGRPAPVVVFLHGWMSTNPGLYGSWIAHLARRGNIVIYPRYQDGLATRPADFLPNALDAIRSALVVLDTAPGRVRPDRERFALIGHSAGGNLAAQLAAVADEAGLPRPRAVVAALPGEVIRVPGPDLARIPASAAMVVLAAEEDVVVGDARAREIFESASTVPPEQKQFIYLRSDRSAAPVLIADHASAMASLPWLDTGEGPFHAMQMNAATVDPLDFSVFWRAADLAMEAGFSGRPLDQLTRSGAVFRQVGRRADGLPVRGPIVSDDLADIPRVTLANGVRLVRWPPAVFDPSSPSGPPRLLPRTVPLGPPSDPGVTRAASLPSDGPIR